MLERLSGAFSMGGRFGKGEGSPKKLGEFSAEVGEFAADCIYRPSVVVEDLEIDVAFSPFHSSEESLR
ncbi:MAG: hypothetical protein NVSMB14_02930 [Isosphaeraceae bacterium]